MNDSKIRVIKRYGNRKLYDTEGSRYVTLDEIARLIRAGEDVQIIDNQSKEDLTSVTLTQIILEEEKKKSRMPLDVLRQMITGSSEAISDFFQERVAKPVQTFREEAEKRVSEGLKKSDATREDLLKHMREWLSANQRSMEDFQKRLDEKVHQTLDGMANIKELRGEFTELQKYVRELEKRLKNLKEKTAEQEKAAREDPDEAEARQYEAKNPDEPAKPGENKPDGDKPE